MPIVMVNLSDPVGQGLVASLARPEGNVTGLSFLAVELGTKRLEVLKDALPRLARVGVLWPRGFSASPQLKELRLAAVALQLKLDEIETQADPKCLERAFKTAKQKEINAIMTTANRTFFTERKRIVELADTYRFPAIY